MAAPRRFLVFVLSLQISLGAVFVPPALAHNSANEGPHLPDLGEEPPVSLHEARMRKELEGFAAATKESPPQPSNIALVANQERWIWNTEGTAVARRFDLNQIDIKLPDTSFFDQDREIEFEYEPDHHRLLCHRLKPVRGKDGPVRTDSHVWNGVDLTAPVMLDSRFVFLATTEGLRLVPLSLLKSDGFNRPVPALLAAPIQPPEEGYRLTGMEVLTRESSPRAFQPMDGSERPAEFRSGDLGLEFSPASGAGEHKKPLHVWVDLDQLIEAALSDWLAVIVLVQIRSPQPDRPELLQELQRFFEEHAGELRHQQERLQQRAALAGDHDDLLLEAASALAERSGLDRQIQALNVVRPANRPSAPRDRFASDPDKSSAWAQDYAMILKERQRLASLVERQSEPVYWEDILASRWTERLASYRSAARLSDQTQRGRFFNGVESLWRKTVSTKGLSVLAATLTATWVAGRQGVPYVEGVEAWLTRAGVWAYDFVGGRMGQYLQEGGSWSAWASGAVRYVPLYFLVVAAFYSFQWTKAGLAGERRESLSYIGAARQIMVYLMKSYLILNRAQELFPKLTRQRHLTKVVDYNIPFGQAGVWNSPLAGGEELAENAEKLNGYVKDRALLNGIATRFAAALLASEKFGVDVASLFQEERRLEQNLLLVAVSEDAQSRMEWMQLSTQVHRAALEILRDREIRLNESDLASNYEFYVQVAERLAKARAEQASAAATYLERLRTAARSGARYLFVHFLVGESGRRLYNQLYYAPLDETAARISFKQGATDFTVSQLAFSMQAPEAFANSEGRLVSSSLEQEYSWKGINPIDVRNSLVEGHEHADQRVGARLHDPGRRVGPVFVRPQNMAEALADGFKGLLDPRSPSEKSYRDPLEAWQQYIKSVWNGISVRFLVPTGFLLYTFGQDIKSWPDAFVATYAAASTALYILLSKLAVRSTDLDSNFHPGLSQFFLGYAMVWPVVTSLADRAKTTVQENLHRLQAAAGDILEGVEHQDLPKMRSGVIKMKALYKQGGGQLPMELNLDSAQYDYDKAMALLNHSLRHIPVPTEKNTVFEVANNVLIGSFISMYLFNDVQVSLVKNQGAGLLDLAVVAGWLGLTYAAVGVTSRYLVKPVLRQVQRFVVRPLQALNGNSPCAKLLGREPINLD